MSRRRGKGTNELGADQWQREVSDISDISEGR